MPSTEATIFSQSSLRAPPPDARPAPGSTPSSRSSSSESRSPYATPSRTERTSAPRSCRRDSPSNMARADGSACGVRSPWRYGRNVSPSVPAGQSRRLGDQLVVRRRRPRRAASAASRPRRASRPSPPRCRGRRGRRRGRAPPGRPGSPASAAKTTPDVPSTTDSGPGPTTPTPSAPACWSPAPPIAVDSCAGGSHSSGISSASQTSSLQRRPATSKSSVPDASAASIARSPVSRSRT